MGPGQANSGMAETQAFATASDTDSYNQDRITDFKITFYDERFSSDVIFKELRKNSLSITKIKKKLNHLSASYILQGFLDIANISK